MSDTPELTELENKIKAFVSNDRVPRIHGWTTEEKAIAMAHLILKERPALAVEIGVFGGRSLVPQAMALKALGRGLIVGIDPFSHAAALDGEVGPENADWWSKLDLDGISKAAWDAITVEGVKDHTALVRCEAQIAAMMFLTGSIGILHIDGNHSEKASCRDVHIYYPLVQTGGYIWFDDADWPTTQMALAVLDARCRRVSAVGNCVLFRK